MPDLTQLLAGAVLVAVMAAPVIYFRRAFGNWRCVVGHDFAWPPHKSPWSLWEDHWIECPRCGTRTVRRCYPDTHWSDRHPTKEDIRA